MIILPVCSLEYVAQGVYVTARHIDIASEYGHDIYANTLDEISSKTTSYEDIIFLVVGTYTRYPFWCCVIPTKIPRKPFCAWWRIFNTFVPTCAVAFRTTHRKNNTCKCDTECFVPVTSLNYVVGSLSSFIRFLIGRNGNIWSVVYINEKWIYDSETIAFTIRECAILHKILHVTFTCQFISWCPGAANDKWDSRVWHSSLKSVKVNYDPVSAEFPSKSHHPNSSICPNMDWNISILSITYSMEIFSMP